MDISPETGKPAKPKMSHLTIASDKSKGIVGKAELDLSLYGDNEFNVFRLKLTECQSEDAYIEVGLKGVPAKPKDIAMPSSPSATSAQSQNAAGSDSLLLLIDDVEKLRKEKNKVK